MQIAVQAILPVFPQIVFGATGQNGTYSTPVNRIEGPPQAPQVVVNRTLPSVMAAPASGTFSETPDDAEISQSHTFSLPLVPIGASAPEENQVLANALMEFRSRTNRDDVKPLTAFLDHYPDSVWKASLLLNLGIFYRHTGWFTKALDAWEQAWALTKDETDPGHKDIADQTVAELLELNARLGRYERLETLFSEINGRHINPSLLPKIDGARQGLWLMQNRPQDAFRCGPMALAQIGAPACTAGRTFDDGIHNSRSTLQGMSLTSVCDLANRLGMNYQMAWRSPGSTIILPAVVHWKAGHYAALVAKKENEYLIKDPTFGDSIWISRAALDGESSGYCLVPDGKLPPGWRVVDATEGRNVFGKGNTGQSDQSRTRCQDPKSCNNCSGYPMAAYAIHLMLVSLNIADVPVGYTPPRGPNVHFQVTYNQKGAYPPEAVPPANFGYSNLGAQWTCNWMAYIVDDPTEPADAAYYYTDSGGFDTYTNFSSSSQSYSIDPDTQSVLLRTSTNSYERDLPDGSKQFFSQSDGSATYPRRIFLTQTIDPAGNAETMTYNSISGGCQLVAVQDAIGQVTVITNGVAGDPFKITSVTDPFGRTAHFTYNTSGQLASITDIIGITSSFNYDTNGAVVALTTPYGTSTFAYGELGRTNWLVATDPLGGQEEAEYVDTISTTDVPDNVQRPPTTISSSDPALNLLYHRNTFFWDKKAMSLYPGDYTKAKIYHWCHATDMNTCSGVLESTKSALEGRIWYTYPGQSTNNTYQIGTNNAPATIARVLDDGTSQIYQYQRNPLGKPTVAVDPSGRTNIMVYATNNVDLSMMGQVAAGVTNVLAQYVYNSQHLPLMAVDAAGQISYFGYNTNGQLLAMTNALSQTVFLDYDTNGYLTNIIDGAINGGIWQPLSTNSFTYDGYGRMRTRTDPLGYTLTYSYDADDRLTYVAYMDGTYEQMVYNYLDPVLKRDRNGHWTAMAYDPLRHLTDTYDNVGRHTHFDWCNCGSLEDIIDPNGNTTTFVRDLQTRLISKLYPDQTAINYFYATNTSRLQGVTDAKNQSTIYRYNIDNNIAQVTYSNAVVATSQVSYTYDTNYNRVLTMTDGTGVTTYNYYPVAAGQLGAGQVSSVSNSFIGPSSVVSYNYDALGRMTNRAINGVSQQVAFDMLNRVSIVENVLGSFTNTYVGATSLISTNFAPFGKETVYSYLSITNDERLAGIWNQNVDGSTLSEFSYGYDPVGNITNWTQQQGALSLTVDLMEYDPVNQLLNSTTFSNTLAGLILKQYAYSYDPAGNRTSEQIGTTNAAIAVSQSTYSGDNQVTNRISNRGSLVFAGNISRVGTVTVNGVPATMSGFGSNFLDYANLIIGTNVVPVTATDYGSHSGTNNYQVVVQNNGVAETFKYDQNGNLTNVVSATGTNSYQWDAANRLVAIVKVSTNVQTSLFAYDGFGRRVQDIEGTNGAGYSTNRFIWDGKELAEQRGSTGGTVVKRFFGQGEQINGTNYYFTRDHLASIREMVTATGAIVAQYSYDPYGRQTVLVGTMSADFGYAGMFAQCPSGLNLTLYRAYSPDLGRWLSRDPLAEEAGLNLYAYVLNNPLNNFDPLGLIEGESGGQTYDRNGNPTWGWPDNSRRPSCLDKDADETPNGKLMNDMSDLMDDFCELMTILDATEGPFWGAPDDGPWNYGSPPSSGLVPAPPPLAPLTVPPQVNHNDPPPPGSFDQNGQNAPPVLNQTLNPTINPNPLYPFLPSAPPYYYTWHL